MGLANILLWWKPGEMWMQICVVQPAFGSLCLSIKVAVRRLGKQPQKGVLPRRLGWYELDSGFLSPTHSIIWRWGLLWHLCPADSVPTICCLDPQSPPSSGISCVLNSMVMSHLYGHVCEFSEVLVVRNRRSRPGVVSFQWPILFGYRFQVLGRFWKPPTPSLS